MNTTGTFVSRLRRPVFLWAVASLAAELAMQWLFENGKLPERMRLLTLLPLLPMTFFVLSLARMIRRMDEMQKRICLEAVAIAFVVTLIVNFLLRSLLRAGLVAHVWDDMAEYMMIFWGAAYLFVTWRYQRPSAP